MIRPTLGKVSEEAAEVRRAVTDKLSNYVGAAFGLVVGLAWNDAIKALIEYYIPFQADIVWAKVLYAFVLTLVITIVAYLFVKVFGLKKEEGK